VTDDLQQILKAVTEADTGIEAVSEATDDHATSTPAIASMLDDAIDKPGTVSGHVEAVADATREQVAEVQESNQATGRLTVE
jgi:methyl-accepting chemotaxis protein